MSPYNERPPFEAGSDTSEAAADSIAEGAASMRARVLAHIKAAGPVGTIDDELEVALGMRHQTASARRRELELLGAVTKTGDRRKTRSGRTAAVYIITAEPEPPAPTQGLLFAAPDLTG